MLSAFSAVESGTFASKLNIEKQEKRTTFKVISLNLLAMQFFRVLMTKNLMRIKPNLLIYSFLKYVRVKTIQE